MVDLALRAAAAKQEQQRERAGQEPGCYALDRGLPADRTRSPVVRSRRSTIGLGRCVGACGGARAGDALQASIAARRCRETHLVLTGTSCIVVDTRISGCFGSAVLSSRRPHVAAGR